MNEVFRIQSILRAVIYMLLMSCFKLKLNPLVEIWNKWWRAVCSNWKIYYSLTWNFYRCNRVRQIFNFVLTGLNIWRLCLYKARKNKNDSFTDEKICWRITSIFYHETLLYQIKNLAGKNWLSSLNMFYIYFHLRSIQFLSCLLSVSALIEEG